MKNEALNSLPQGYPFRFLDKILELNAEKGIAIKNVTIGEAFFQGHFRENPIMPGVLIVEAMAQLSGLVMNCAKEEKGIAYLAQIRDIRFKRLVAPGDQLRLIAEAIQKFASFVVFSVTAFVDDNVVAEGELVMGGAKKKT